MAKFSYTMTDEEAAMTFKKSLKSQQGNPAIIKDTGKEITVGSPMMTVKITFNNGVCETKGSLAGKIIVATVDSCLDLTEGFTRM